MNIQVNILIFLNFLQFSISFSILGCFKTRQIYNYCFNLIIEYYENGDLENYIENLENIEEEQVNFFNYIYFLNRVSFHLFERY